MHPSVGDPTSPDIKIIGLHVEKCSSAQLHLAVLDIDCETTSSKLALA